MAPFDTPRPRAVPLLALLSLAALAGAPCRGQTLTRVPLANDVRQTARLPISGEISSLFYLDGFPREGDAAFQVYAFLDAVEEVNLASGRNVTVELYLKDGVPPTVEDFTERSRVKLSLFNDTRGVLSDRVDYGINNSASRWFVALLLRYIDLEGGTSDDGSGASNATEYVTATINAAWGDSLCVPRSQFPGIDDVKLCTMVDYSLHKVPGVQHREEGVLRYLNNYAREGGVDSGTCNELNLNMSCAFWYPICDTGGWKLPVCFDMCSKWAIDCAGPSTDTRCPSAAPGFCTGFPLPKAGLSGGAILLIVLVSLIILGIVVGAVIGYFRKKQFREQMEREREEREQARVPDQYGITAGTSVAPPVLHQAVIHVPNQGDNPTPERKVRTFDVTRSFDDPMELPGTDSDVSDSDA